MHLIFVQISSVGPILENKILGAIFPENGQRNVENGQNTWKFGQKMYKIRKCSEKGQVTACDNRTQ